MNEKELTAWMYALSTDRAELETLQQGLQRQRHEASDEHLRAVNRGDGSAKEARRALGDIEAKLRIIEHELS